VRLDRSEFFTAVVRSRVPYGFCHEKNTFIYKPLSQRCKKFSLKKIEKKKKEGKTIIKKGKITSKIAKGAKDEYEERKRQMKKIWKVSS